MGWSLSLGEASQWEVEGPLQVLSSGWPWRKVTLPLGDVCIPFLNRPIRLFPSEEAVTALTQLHPCLGWEQGGDPEPSSPQ